MWGWGWRWGWEKGRVRVGLVMGVQVGCGSGERKMSSACAQAFIDTGFVGDPLEWRPEESAPWQLTHPDGEPAKANLSPLVAHPPSRFLSPPLFPPIPSHSPSPPYIPPRVQSLHSPRLPMHDVAPPAPLSRSAQPHLLIAHFAYTKIDSPPSLPPHPSAGDGQGAAAADGGLSWRRLSLRRHVDGTERHGLRVAGLF